MKKVIGILCICLMCCALFLTGCKPNTPNTPELPDNGDGGEITEPSKNIQGFDNLAKSIATVNIVTDDGQDITGTPQLQEYKGCSVSVENGRDGENFSGATGKVRIRGNNTAEYDKKSFRIKFDNKINLLGLNGGAEFKNWVLLACYKDVTFLRDALVFELARQTLVKTATIRPITRSPR